MNSDSFDTELIQRMSSLYVKDQNARPAAPALPLTSSLPQIQTTAHLDCLKLFDKNLQTGATVHSTAEHKTNHLPSTQIPTSGGTTFCARDFANSASKPNSSNHDATTTTSEGGATSFAYTRTSFGNPFTAPNFASNRFSLSNQSSSTSNNPSYIYGLECENKKYYVGRTGKDPQARLAQHMKGGQDGASWTRLHKPLRMIFCFPETSSADEDNHTLRMMEEHGIENVRGGTFAAVHLPMHHQRTILDIQKSRAQCCYKCGKQGHFANTCTTALVPLSPQLVSSFDNFIAAPHKQPHLAPESVSTTSTSNNISLLPNPLSGSPSDSSPPSVLLSSSQIIQPGKKHTFRRFSVQKKSRPVCERCGHIGHTQEMCHANFHFVTKLRIVNSTSNTASSSDLPIPPIGTIEINGQANPEQGKYPANS